MHVSNIHERTIPATPNEIGALLDGLASAEDRLWPHDAWPPMRLDKPLGVGAAGGHGPIRYIVESYEPGRRIVFRFRAPAGFDGLHTFEVLPAAETSSLLRHSLIMTARGAAMLTWPFLYRPLHDALVEDALDRASRTFGLPHETRWSWWVKLTRRALHWVLARRRPARSVDESPAD